MNTSLADSIASMGRALTADELAKILAVSKITIFKHAKAISSRAARDCQILPYKMTVCGQHVQDAEPGLTLAWDWERWLLRTHSRRNTAEPLHFKTKHAIGDGERDGCWVSASNHLTLPALRISAPASSSRFT